MKRLIHFFSLAIMTQLILMAGQLILLPIQVRLWGQAETAVWYSALALATVTYVVDCGLRTAGHSELMKAHSNPSEFPREAVQFRQVWSWIRVLIVIVTSLLIAGDLVADLLLNHGAYPLWRAVLILACALETVLIIRITYLDSLGSYRGAEASYFGFAVLRLIFSIPALTIFHCTAAGLAGVYLFTAAVALIAQGYWLIREHPLLKLNDKFPTLHWKSLSLARYTIAEPLANWTRLSLPVLVIGQIAPPMAVTTYVALRAVFGAGRTTVQQLARVASVEYLRSRKQAEPQRSESVLTLFVIVAVLFGSCVGLFVLIDNMRLLGLWLKHFDRQLFQQIAFAFALTAPFFSYQIPMNLMFRSGELAAVARRHYGFVLCSGVFAAVALFSAVFPLYLAMLVVAELGLSVAFFAAHSETRSGVTAILVAACAGISLSAVWFFAQNNIGGIFSDFSTVPMAASFALLLVIIASAVIALIGQVKFHATFARVPVE